MKVWARSNGVTSLAALARPPIARYKKWLLRDNIAISDAISSETKRNIINELTWLPNIFNFLRRLLAVGRVKSKGWKHCSVSIKMQGLEQ